ncbi:MAG TPA: VOC family protein [Myxococcota bacterium]|nr:VOC family protein [Myxococcota bacterium]
MIRTHGLSHVSLSVADPERSLAFYRALFGVREYFRDEGSIQALGPGPNDVLAFERRSGAGRGGIDHFGFRLADPSDADDARRQIEAAGGRVLRHGEFGPGMPYVFFEDPDGHRVEVWYEPPQPP